MIMGILHLTWRIDPRSKLVRYIGFGYSLR